MFKDLSDSSNNVNSIYSIYVGYVTSTHNFLLPLCGFQNHGEGKDSDHMRIANCTGVATSVSRNGFQTDDTTKKRKRISGTLLQVGRDSRTFPASAFGDTWRQGGAGIGKKDPMSNLYVD